MSDGDLRIMTWETNGQRTVRVRVEPSEEWRDLEVLADPENPGVEVER